MQAEKGGAREAGRRFEVKPGSTDRMEESRRMGASAHLNAGAVLAPVPDLDFVTVLGPAGQLLRCELHGSVWVGACRGKVSTV